MTAPGFQVDERRTLRVSEAVREELGEIIGFEMDDPRVFEVTVTGVEVSSDARYATVKVTAPGDQHAQNQAVAALIQATGYLRRELASRLPLRHIPELQFESDKHPNAERRVDILLKRAKKSRGRTQN